MDLKEYVKRIYALEQSCYEQSRIINGLKNQLYREKNPTYWSMEKVPSRKSISEFVVEGIAAGIYCAIGFAIFGLIIDIILCLFAHWIFEMRFTFLCPILGIILCIILAYYWDVPKSKIKEIESENQKIFEKNQQVKMNSKIRAANLQRKIVLAEEVYKQTCMTLKRFYDVGIIYPKYRGLVPVAMFCEYLSSGRCDCLEGHEGAYNIYEQELRMNLILSKLDDVIERLDQIKENQYMLANAIKESNQISRQICNIVIDCNNQLQVIGENTAAAEYYNRISALNTTYMAWFKEYR